MRAPPESLRPIDRRADLHRLISITLQIFSAWASLERAAEHGEVLRVHEDEAAVDHAVAGYDAVARDLVVGHAEVDAAVLDEHVPFLERALVEQQLQPLARRELALAVLRGDALFAAAQARLGALAFELFDDVVHEGRVLVATLVVLGKGQAGAKRWRMCSSTSLALAGIGVPGP